MTNFTLRIYWVKQIKFIICRQMPGSIHFQLLHSLHKTQNIHPNISRTQKNINASQASYVLIVKILLKQNKKIICTVLNTKDGHNFIPKWISTNISTYKEKALWNNHHHGKSHPPPNHVKCADHICATQRHFSMPHKGTRKLRV